MMYVVANCKIKRRKPGLLGCFKAREVLAEVGDMLIREWPLPKPMCWPLLLHNGAKYFFAKEREIQFLDTTAEQLRKERGLL